ncbi:MAG: ribonuclease HII [Eubacteriales bacterium]|nr:ribonuclease HII [Eubacteriales bacterium]
METKQYSLSELKVLIDEADEKEYAEIAGALSSDGRAGVRKLGQSLDRRIKAIAGAEARIDELKAIENGFYSEGVKLIAGCDEAGRGPLCGPVAAAVVILPEDSRIRGVDDSKKLSAKKREELYERITGEAVSWGIGIVSSDTIDRINILQATRLAVKKALEAMSVKPGMLLTDALKIDYPVAQKAYVKGDSTVYSIAAASILAKVSRDRIMDEFDRIYPEYGFSENRGYGTEQHMRAIEKYGPTPIHRRTFLSKEALDMPKHTVGTLFEDKAAAMLIERGHSILERDYSCGESKVDFISLTRGITVFTAVLSPDSSMSESRHTLTDDARITCAKQAAEAYIREKRVETPVRFDIIIFEVSPKGGHTVRMIENAF